jgi:hypothetical protein
MIEHYKGVVPTGFPVLWYPHGVVDDAAVPYVAFVTKGWTLGICDLVVLPAQDGAVEARDQVFCGGDARLYDSYGRLSPGAHARGCWLPVPWQPLPPVASEKKKAVAK